MRTFNRTTVMIAALLTLASCQGDEKTVEMQVSMPQAAVSGSDQPLPLKAQSEAQPEAQLENPVSEASTLAAAKHMPVQTNMPVAKSVKNVAPKPVNATLAKVEKTVISDLVSGKNIPAKPSVLVGDAHQGKKLAKRCAACHDFGSKNKTGPALGAVFGRQAATAPGYRYVYAAFIPADKAWHWDEPHLAAWLCDSKKAVRSFTGNAKAKTKMSPQRICDAKKQRDIIAYLKTL
ncbi:MAG: c-type cytochrome [Mariprofundaceae bacterium]